MISYSQNCEDVILNRIFRDRAQGRYVDVGAHFPVIDSVTEHFYRKGWHGINVEPLPAAFAELRAARPRDINVNCAVGDADGSQRFFALDGLSTLIAEVAGNLAASVGAVSEIVVETLRLATLLERHPIGDIDFLKVDVEGAEGMVLQSNDWQRFRPTVVLAEAVHPVTHAPMHLAWEGVLLEVGYHFVYFDGLNRFYWNSALPPPPPECFVPPNVLDRYTPYVQIATEARAAEAARVAQYERQHAADAESRAAEQVSAQERVATNQLTKIAGALRRLVQGAAEPAPYADLAGPWQVLVAARQAAEALKQRNKAMDIELREAHAVLQSGQARADDLAILLQVSERRRLEALRDRNMLSTNVILQPDPSV